jgi:hypothetical protein
MKRCKICGNADNLLEIDKSGLYDGVICGICFEMLYGTNETENITNDKKRYKKLMKNARRI